MFFSLSVKHDYYTTTIKGRAPGNKVLLLREVTAPHTQFYIKLQNHHTDNIMVTMANMITIQQPLKDRAPGTKVFVIEGGNKVS